MVASSSFADFLREQLAPLGRVTLRRMFGKTGVFCNGVMFGMVTDNTLYLRVDDHTDPLAELQRLLALWSRDVEPGLATRHGKANPAGITDLDTIEAGWIARGLPIRLRR